MLTQYKYITSSYQSQAGLPTGSGIDCLTVHTQSVEFTNGLTSGQAGIDYNSGIIHTSRANKESLLVFVFTAIVNYNLTIYLLVCRFQNLTKKASTDLQSHIIIIPTTAAPPSV